MWGAETGDVFIVSASFLSVSQGPVSHRKVEVWGVSYSESCLLLVCVSCLLLLVLVSVYLAFCHLLARVPQLRLCVYVYFRFELNHTPSLFHFSVTSGLTP